MNFFKYIYDADAVKKTLVEQGDAVITTTGCRIYIPVRFAEQGLALLGDETFIFGFFAILPNFPALAGQEPTPVFAVSTACTMIGISPSTTKIIKDGENSYYEFGFDPYTEVINNVNVVMDDTLPYQMYREFIQMGRVPPYLNYEQQAGLFDSVLELCGVSLGAKESILSMIASSVFKDPNDLRRSYAFALKSIEDMRRVRPALVPFRDVQFGTTNTTARLMGSYPDLAVTSALVNPSERLEDMEELLRL